MRKEFKICTVVQGENLAAFLKNLKKAQKSSTMVELRVDSIKYFKIEDVMTLGKATKVSSIFTFRHAKEGGLFSGTITKQKIILKKAFDSGFTYIDISLNHPVVNELTTKEKKRLILSWHDFQKTPSLLKLLRIFEKMRQKKPAIIKMAAMVNTTKDMANLSLILSAKKKSEKLIVIGMGEKGKLTRKIFPLLGSYITYVSMKGEKNTAPGMMTENELLKTL